MLRDTTLVLGGGGVWGAAWMTGLIAGLEDGGIDIRHPRSVIGTSAGAVVGAQLTTELATQELFERQLATPQQVHQSAAEPGNTEVSLSGLLGQQWSDPDARLRAICELALNAKTIPWPLLRAGLVKAGGARAEVWPSTPLMVTAVNANTCSPQMFDARSGVNIVDAVAASSAVPGRWPPVPIGDHLYIDGGFWRSGEHLYLADSAPSVLVISPFARSRAPSSGGNPTFEDDVAQLRANGSHVMVITADTSSLATLGKGGATDPSTRKAGAKAGRMQGLKEAPVLRAAFS